MEKTQVPVKKNNASVELLRFLAASIIVLCHWEQLSGVEAQGFTFAVIGVEFFLMVTGFYMMAGIMRKTSAPAMGEGLVNSFKKAKRIFPEYLIALIFSFIVYIIQNNVRGAGEAISYLFHFKWEFFSLQMLGFTPNPSFNTDYLMGPGWYLSSMFIALIFVYAIARRSPKAYIGFVAPIAVIGVYAYELQTYGTLDVGNEVVGGFMMLGNLRAFAGISLGALSWFMCDCIKKGEMTRKKRRNLGIAEVLCWIALIALPIFSNQINAYDLAAWLPVLAMLLCVTNTHASPIEGFLERKLGGVCRYLGRLSLCAYLFHWGIELLLRRSLVTLLPAAGYLIALGVTLIVSAALDYAMRTVRGKLKKKEEAA